MKKLFAYFWITAMVVMVPFSVMADEAAVHRLEVHRLEVHRLEVDRLEVHRLVDGFHQAAAESRFDDYFSSFSVNGHFLGTDASERWTVDEFKEYARAPFAEGRGWKYTVMQRNVESAPDSENFWFDEILMNAGLGRCRGTGVVIKEAGEWKIAHYSLTLLIPNDIADEVGRSSMVADGLAAEK